ncbi:MAG: GNAT family N-acetyltransferase [Tahibacter sp.]
MVFSLRFATAADVPVVLELIRALADYEHLLDQVHADEDVLRSSLFGARPVAEVVLAEVDGQNAGFAIFFHNFSTFLGKPGLYLEDLFVRPAFRGHGYGRMLMVFLAQIALERGCGRFEWWVLDWNRPSIDFYRGLGAVAMDEWTVQRVSGDALNALAQQPSTAVFVDP